MTKFQFAKPCWLPWHLIMVFLLVVPASFGQEQHVLAKLIANTTAIQAGKPFKLGVMLTMMNGWHTYYRVSGQSGRPTRINWILPNGFKSGSLVWQNPKQFVDGGLTTYGYDHNALIAATITPPAVLPPGSKFAFSAQVNWVECKELCIPGQAQISLTLPMVSSKIVAKPINEEFFAQLPNNQAEATKASRGSIIYRLQDGALILILAFIGGFILNFMPCVLPVIAIKVLDLMEQTKNSPQRTFQLGLAFAAGIMASFLVLALITVIIKSAGAQIGWGFQFQQPVFLVFMSSILVLFALSLFDVFHIYLSGSQFNDLANQEGYTGSFFKGVLATILATPCTAPFLGTAIGFALTRSAPVIFTIFLVIALGMAAPYLLLSAFPKLRIWIPKPGNWMDQFKKSMGFVLLGTVAWLLWILGQQCALEGMAHTLSFLLALAFITWLSGQIADLRSSALRRWTVWILSIATISGAYIFWVAPTLSYSRASTIIPSTAPASPWHPFRMSALNEAIHQHKTVFLDFTANWCLTCKVNEAAVINNKVVQDTIQSLNVTAFKVDWTRQDPDITALLKKFGRAGVPLYVVIPGRTPQEPIILPELVTTSLVVNALRQAGASL